MKSIKDLIYFDVEKARSIISQLNGGLISEISRAFEDETELNSGLGFNVKIIKGNVGGKDKERQLRTEKIEIYHELLNQIEDELSKNKLLTDLNKEFESFGGSFNQFMDITSSFNYIKACGWSQFEDFERFKTIFSNFNEIQRLIFSSILSEDPTIKTCQKQIKDARKKIESLDRDRKAKELSRLKALEKELDSILQDRTDMYTLDEEFIRRMKIFLDTFSPNRLNFRLTPLESFNHFQILANLKDKYLVDSNFESIIYTYGTRPNIKLSILGIITSCPRLCDNRVNPNDEFLSYTDSELNDTQGFDKAFRNVFSSFEEFEKFFFVPSFPKLAISPIAIYREVLIAD